MARQDILLDTDHLPQIANGDFVCGDSDDQHVELLLMATPGQFKENPLVGVGLQKYINKPTTTSVQMKRNITVGLAADGYKVTKLIPVGGSFELDYKIN